MRHPERRTSRSTAPHPRFADPLPHERGEGLTRPSPRDAVSRSLAALVACVAAIQLFLAHRYYGFLGGDDVEVLEEAFHRAIGLPHQAWDIRNLFVPDVIVAPAVAIAHALGVVDRRLLIEIASWPFIALTAATIVLVFRLGGLPAAALFAFHWIPLGFGSTPYPRTLATFCVVLAVVMVDRFPAISGALIALAFADRFSEIVFLVPLLLIARNRWRVLLGAIAGVIAFGGIYDWITWGTPFRSLVKFAHLTIVQPDFASRVKYQSPLWYIANIGRWCAPTLLVLIAFGRRQVKWSFLLIPLLALSMVRHKELRYLQAMIPFIAIAGGAGFAALWQRGQRALAAALLAVSLLWNAYGLHVFERKSMPAVMAAQYIDRDPTLRAVAVPQAWAFGRYLYFHRPVALHEVGTPPRDIPPVDAIAVYETDLDVTRIVGFTPRISFRDDPARAVLLFTRSASGTSDRVRR